MSFQNELANTRGEAWTEVLVDLMYISIMCCNNNSRHVDAEQISGSWFGLYRYPLYIPFHFITLHLNYYTITINYYPISIILSSPDPQH